MSNNPGNNGASRDERPRLSGGIPGRGGGPMHRTIEKAKNPKQALERLLPYLKPFRLPLIGVMVCVVVYTLLGLVGPYLMGLAIDRFIDGKDPQGLLNLALLMLLTYFLYQRLQCHRQLGHGARLTAGAQEPAPTTCSSTCRSCRSASSIRIPPAS